MMLLYTSAGSFPKQTDYARLLFEEAARNFRDSYVLHRNRRYAAAITSASKSVELGLKALLMLDAATTLIPDLFQIHRVYQLVFLKHDIFLTTHVAMLNSHSPALKQRLVELEDLTPNKTNQKKRAARKRRI